ncbi:hypothetical protein [Telluribacter sp.]|jgi:hypothetical protein|uniref:hypothetical protein n=1 Tax=Telluribacter sp. TaxID=1978767 RepID=UPI002E0D3098|nr:hypothetical protein [Telluribacter sp.]
MTSTIFQDSVLLITAAAFNITGKNTTLYPGLTYHFRKETKRFRPDVYQRVRQVPATKNPESASR